MKKKITVLLACVLLLSSMLSVASAHQIMLNQYPMPAYVDIEEINNKTEHVWQATYTTSKGETVVIDTPVIVPDVDKLPIIRVTWNEPVLMDDMTLEVIENSPLVTTFSKNNPSTYQYTLLSDGESANSDYTWDEAPDAFIELLHEKIPAFSNVDLQMGNMLAFSAPGGNSAGNGGLYQMLFYQRFHGVPFLVRSGFRYPMRNIVEIPGNSVYGILENENSFFMQVSLVKEIGIEADDVPLLPFSEIKKVFEERITSGYVARFDEVQLGYMLFFDESKLGQEYLLAPVWVAIGAVRGDLKVSFSKEQNRETEFLKYGNLSKIAINAQTGELYLFDTDKRENRQHFSGILTWNEVH